MSDPHPFLLICGCPRSGTYLLSKMVAQRFDIVIPPETHLIPQFFGYRWLWKTERSPLASTRLLQAIACFEEIWIRYGSGTRKRASYRDLSISPDAAALRVDRPASFAELIRALFDTHRQRFGREAVGEKSAPYRPETLEAYAAVFPDLRVVHLVRDGRDVSASWHGQWFGPTDVREAARRWVEHIDVRQAWGSRNPALYLEIQYEQLIAQPDATLDLVAGFAGLRPASAPAGTGIAEVLADDATHVKLAGSVDPRNAGRWRETMSDTELSQFEEIAGPTLARLGYAPAADAMRPVPSGLLREALSRGRALASANAAKRWLRSHLPLLIRTAQLVAPGRISPTAAKKDRG